jgi:hypothetical protein
MQHMRSFTAESLRTLLETHSFEVVFCRGVSLPKFQDTFKLPSWKYAHLAMLYKQVVYATSRLIDRLTPQSFPCGREMNARLVPGRNLCAVVMPK